jgi:alkaline phosphatase
MLYSRSLIFLLALFPFGLHLEARRTGSVIFIHPDGTGLGHWNAARHYYYGPDGKLNWDRMDRLGAYRPHQKNWLSTTSHAGATVHAYAKKVHHNSYGLDNGKPLTALSGKRMTIMEEAMAGGYRAGIINSGHVGEPGTGVFLARTDKRYEAIPEIAAQIIHSGAGVIFCGGEIYFIAKGMMGQHGQEGIREDGRDLLSEARANGYTVIFTRDELLSLSDNTEKVLGIFASEGTYNARPMAQLREQGLPTYKAGAPTVGEMTAVALRILGSDANRKFLLVVEEEGTDDFSNNKNAQGMLDAIGRADAAIGHALAYINEYPERPTLLLVGADSDAGHPTLWSPVKSGTDFKLRERSESGAETHGPDGMGGEPFWSKPDNFGNSYPFGIIWADKTDLPGSAVTKAHGLNADLLRSSIDNTGIYRIIHETLFGSPPGE